ncbi:MAG TPA: YkgJ family cysteine cluster protein [Gammaproteobacteria bacterium]
MSNTSLNVTLQITPENKCSFCRGSLCCAYITQKIDTPRTMRDFDHLLWQTAHHEVQIYKDEGDWYLLVNNKCKFLQPDGRCGTYETRPAVCREHKNDYCEFDAPAEEGFELFFDSYESLLAYCRKRYKNWDKRFKKTT